MNDGQNRPSWLDASLSRAQSRFEELPKSFQSRTGSQNKGETKESGRTAVRSSNE